MPPTQKRKFLRSQGRELVAKVYEFMKKEATEQHAEKLTDARWRTSQATGVSEGTVTRILREKRAQCSTSMSFTTPLKKRNVKPRKINIEEFDVGVIRRTIQQYHNEFNQTPSLDNMRDILKEKILFNGSRASLRTMLFNLGYRWRKTETRRKLLTETHDVQWARYNYLKQIKELRDSGRPIVYTDESFIYSNNEQNKSMVKKDPNAKPEETKPKSTKGPRIIMVHAGSAAGFVPNALLLYNNLEAKAGPYLNEIDSESYLKWVETHLIPNLPKDAVVVMDNAAYHNTIAEKFPTINSSKQEMQSWLNAKGIEYEEEFLRIELYNLIKKSKEKYRSYKVDEMLKVHNFTVVRLPIHHPDLSPIENIWDLIRNYVVSHGTEQNSTSILNTLNKGFEEVNSQWASACRHVQKIEEEYMKYFEMDCTVIITDASDSESDSDDMTEVSDNSNSDIEIL